MVETHAVPRRNPASAFRVVDGQAVVAIAEKGEIHVLNDVGTRVWALVDGRRTVEAIVAEVGRQLAADGYDGIPADLGEDVRAFLADAAGKGMLDLADAT